MTDDLDLPMEAKVHELSEEQLSHLARGLEQTFGCTIRKTGIYLWLGLVEFEGGVLINPQRTVRDMWDGAKAMEEGGKEYERHKASVQATHWKN